MPYAKNGDINIYYEVEGEGPPLVLQHGFSDSLEGWREYGYVDALQNDYQLILIDARGHGKSDKPHNPEAYSYQNFVRDITTVLDVLDIEITYYFGFSMGGVIGFRFAELVPKRVMALIIGGSGGGAGNPDPDRINARIKLLEAGPEVYVTELDKDNKMSPSRRATFLANDHEALIALMKQALISTQTESHPDVTDEFSSMTLPFLLYVGESDPNISAVEKANQLLPNATFFSLPGLDHNQTFHRSDLVLPHVKEFLARVSK